MCLQNLASHCHRQGWMTTMRGRICHPAARARRSLRPAAGLGTPCLRTPLRLVLPGNGAPLWLHGKSNSIRIRGAAGADRWGGKWHHICVSTRLACRGRRRRAKSEDSDPDYEGERSERSGGRTTRGRGARRTTAASNANAQAQQEHAYSHNYMQAQRQQQVCCMQICSNC